MAKKRIPRATPAAQTQLGTLALPGGYDTFLQNLKGRIRTAQLQAALAVNRELIALYWHVGQCIVERQERDG